MTFAWPQSVHQRLREICAIHFDPDGGAPYWIDRARELGFDPRDEINTVDDLYKLGVMDPASLAACPLEDFLPRSGLDPPPRRIVAQTGGTLGNPVWTAYIETEFDAAFVEPFCAAAGHVGFPHGGAWLYVGPSGPHVIGRAADSIARRLGAAAPFSVDFDVRWARKLPSGSFAAQRYLCHIIDQSLDVIRTQPVTTLFTTPVVLRPLADAMTAAQRRRVRGVHYGGLAIEPEDLKQFQEDVFPEAVHLAGYGNTLFGCCLELSLPAGRPLRYFPHGARLVFGTLEGDAAPAYGTIGTEGRLIFTRLDRTMFLANLVERDHVHLIAPPSGAPPAFALPGVEAPAPIREARPGPSVSLY
ncbi:MAG: hypothetical protein ACE5F9_11840 [Phycisphaerae bacterium]